MVDRLEVLAQVCTYLTGLKYPTLSMASLAFYHLLNHCNGFLVRDAETCECHRTTLTDLQIQQKVSERCVKFNSV